MKIRTLLKPGRIKRVILIMAIGVLVAGLVTGLVWLFGAIDLVPNLPLASLGIAVPSVAVLFVPLFSTIVFSGLLYLFGSNKIGKKFKQTQKQFGQLPAVAKAIITGLPFAVIAGASVGLTDYFAYNLPNLIWLLVAGLVWVTVSFITFRQLMADRHLGRWFKMLAFGTGVAVVLSLVAVGVDNFLYPATPNYVPLLVLLLGAPPITFFVVYRVRSEREGFLSKLLVKTGFAQLRQLQTLTVALAVGFLLGIFVGIVVNFLGGGALVTVLTFLLVWIVVSAIATQLFDRTSQAHTDLVIEEVRQRSSGANRELAVRNDRDEPVDLREAKIRDTEFNLYRTNIDVILAAGETGKFDIPPSFSLYPNTDDVEVNLPLGFSINQRADSPVIVTRNGEKFELQWDEDARRGADAPGDRAESPEEAV